MKKTYKQKVRDLINIKNIQCSKGTYDESAYMRGLANGLILAVSIFDGKKPKFIEVRKRGR